ncbi:MAG TPA: response regulator [Azospirillaceae bacterium]|nr:response regulator [Azospirillaceae bacterium]
MAVIDRPARRRATLPMPGMGPRGAGLLGLVLGLGAAGLGMMALRASERRRQARDAFSLLDSVLEASPIGVSLMDTRLVVRQLNPALAAMTGRPREESIGYDAFRHAPELRPVLAPVLRQVLREGRVFTDMPVERADPEDPSRMRHYIASYFPLLATDGTRIGVGAAVSDVTRLRETEESTRRSEERFRSLIEATSAIVWTTPSSGWFIGEQASWRAFTGQSEAELAGWGWLQAVHPDDRAKTETAWRAAVERRAPYETEHRVRRHDGAWRDMLVRAVPVMEPDGTIREWVGAHLDITARKRAEAQLAEAKAAAEEANRAKSRFIANMSHELRTPLSAVIGYAEMLEEELGDAGQDTAVEDLRKIESNARHLLDLINGVLDISKIEAGRMEVHLETFDLEEVVRGAAETVQALVEKNGNRLAVELGEGLGTMRSDLVKVRQCLFNLLGNAAKFTENGTVTLRVSRIRREEGDRVVLAVSDTGIGMTEEQAANLFQRFVQADSSTTRRFGGTGLGLAITRAFADMLGGRIEVRTAPGQGTTFTLTLPAVLKRGAVPAAEGGTEPVAGSAPVLVIDDEPPMRELMSRFLRREGFAPVEAEDGRTGLELARRVRPAAILLDVMMPTLDGWSVLSELKRDPDLADIPVIMVTSGRGRGLALSLGAAEFVSKPVDWQRLKTALDRIPCLTPPCRALVISDDAETTRLLRDEMEAQGWEVHETGTEGAWPAKVEAVEPSVILLDFAASEPEGVELLRQLREGERARHIPVVAVTGRQLLPVERAALQGRVRGLVPHDGDDPEALLDGLREALAVVRSGRQVDLDAGVAGED